MSIFQRVSYSTPTTAFLSSLFQGEPTDDPLRDNSDWQPGRKGGGRGDRALKVAVSQSDYFMIDRALPEVNTLERKSILFPNQIHFLSEQCD